jgi:DNA-directed RNA polymerase specialized sigma24 family protein
MKIFQHSITLHEEQQQLKNYFGLTLPQFEALKLSLQQDNAVLFEKMFIKERLGQFFTTRVRTVVQGKSTEFLEDLTADCIAHWYQKVKTMPYEQFTYALLTTIIQRFCMTELNKQSRLTQREQLYMKEIQQSTEGYEDFKEQDFQIQLDQAAQRVTLALQQMCTECRRLLEIYLVEERSERETLELLGLNITRDALQARLKKCKLKFQSAFLGIKVTESKPNLLKRFFQYEL